MINDFIESVLISKRTRCAILSLLAVVMLIGCNDSKEAKSVGNTSPITLIATEDFETPAAEAKLWYIDNDRQSLAVDAEKFKNQFASAQTIFNGQPGNYQIRLTALTEIDGESQYQVSVDNKMLTLVTNPETETDFFPVVHQWQNISLSSGAVIRVAFNAVTNGKIPEGDITAYSRGRWTKLELLCTSICID